MRSDDPPPGNTLSVSTPCTRAIVRTSPAHAVGGDVRTSQGRCASIARITLGEGGNHASSTSALITVVERSSVSNSSPIASKNAPPW